MKRDALSALRASTGGGYNADAVPALPEFIRTKGGVVFDPSAPVWAYRDGVSRISLNFSFESALEPRVRQAMRATLAWYAENHSPSHLEQTFAAMKAFVGLKLADKPNTVVSEICGEDVLSYRHSMHNYLKRFAAFVKKWSALGYPGIAPAALAAFTEMTMKGNAIGEAVLTRDPVTGPFTDIERAGIEDALNSAYAAGTLPEDQYLLAWLFMATGARPVQFAAMKVCDLSATTLEDGSVQHILRIPRAKQRADLRASLKERPLTTPIGAALLRYAARVREDFRARLAEPDQAPLFPGKAHTLTTADATDATWNAYHRTGNDLGRSLRDALNKLDIKSERTGKAMNLNPRRFRYTFGTNAAREGHGLLVIAELLDHSWTATAGVYVAASPEMADRVERATALQLAPLAQAFKGVLIKDESEATRSADPSSRIIDLRVDRSAKPMGSCGQHGFCGFLAPVACYTCQNFEPWLDGPHEAVLDFLLLERDKHGADQRVAAINDRTILAVAQVVQLCRDVHQGEGNG